MTGYLFLAAVCDRRTGKIPNALILCGYMTALLVTLLTAGLHGVPTLIGNALRPIVLLYLLFLIRALGAGDLKLLSVVSAFLGTAWAAKVILGSFLIGAVISSVRILRTRQTRERLLRFFCWTRDCFRVKKLLPYETREEPESYLHFGVCIFLSYCGLLLLVSVSGNSV